MMFIRPTAAENAWHAGAAVAKDAFELATMRRGVLEKLRTCFDDLPPTGVDHDEEVEMVFHTALGTESWLDEALDFLAKLHGAEWLGDEECGIFKAIIMTDGELTSGTEDHDRDVAGIRIILEGSEGILAIHDGHDVIEKDDTGFFATSDCDGLATINGTQHTTPQRSHGELGHPAHVGFVINDEDGFIGGHESKYGVGVLKAVPVREPE